jgi:SAM-dependent methyltransferase
MGDTYTHGHHESVLRSHRWRTAENSAAYLLPHLRAGLDLLDVGCGPGTITRDLARLVAPGTVTGLDAAPDAIEAARADTAAPGEDAPPVTFRVGDVYALDVPDGSFDVCHAHQMLQHLTDPVAALTEMRRVTRPGGIVAARDSIYSAMSWSPADPVLDRWLALYRDVTAANATDWDAGIHLRAWARSAGFDDLTTTSSTWTFVDEDTRHWWGGLWADRVELSAFAEQAVAYGLSDPAELATIAATWRRWAAQPDGVFVVVHGEIVARR